MISHLKTTAFRPNNKKNDFKPKTLYFEIVLGIGGSSPMNESDLLMTSLSLVLPPHYHNSSPLNYIDVEASIYDIASGV